MIEGRRLNAVEKCAYRLLSLTDIENHTLRVAVKRFAATVPAGCRILDIGAGLKPYAGLFRHCRYESTDFANCEGFFSNLDDGRRSSIAGRHTYICPVDAIPVPAQTYDYVICTQVLEHVPDPRAAVRELYRILKTGGRAFITVPQGYGIHGEPYNFFYFTKYGLDLILSEAGFNDIKIAERGGYFYYLYDRLAYAIPRIIVGYKQHMSLMLLLLAPIHILLAYAIGPVLLLLEPLDRERRFTLGYVTVARKMKFG